MIVKLPNNVSVCKDLEALKKAASENFAVLENILGNINVVYNVNPPKPLPKGSDLRAGDLLINRIVYPNVISSWDGKKWVPLVLATLATLPDTGLLDAPPADGSTLTLVYNADAEQWFPA